MRHYRDADAARLMEGVAAQGGRWLDETCASEEHEFIMPNGKVRTMLGTGCEETALFLVKYDPAETVIVNEPRLVEDDDPDAPKGRRKALTDDDDLVICDPVEHKGEPSPFPNEERAFVKVCANDDLMREWPRFRKLMQHGDPTKGDA